MDWHPASDEAWTAAAVLADHLQAGGELPELDTTLQLNEDEILHIGVTAHCWWYGAIDVTYERYQFLVFGSLPWLGLTAATSAIGNHRRRRSAAALAAPQWRPLGEQPILLTNQRLLLPVDDDLTSFWLTDILHVDDQPAAQSLQLLCEGQPHLALQGEWVPYVGVALRGLNPGYFIP